MRITIALEPALPVEDLAPGVPNLRQFLQLDDLARELREESGAEVGICETLLTEVATDGFVLLVPASSPGASIAALPPTSRADVGPRVFLLEGERGNTLDLLNELSLAGAVEYGTYFAWKTGSQATGAWGIHGRILAAEAMGATILWDEGDYCLFRDGTTLSFVPMLVRYLSALEGVLSEEE